METAKRVKDAQRGPITGQSSIDAVGVPDTSDADTSELEIVRCQALMEQDFGFYEGKPFYARPREGNSTGKLAHQMEHGNDPGFVPPESKESMATRADSFLDEHLLPLFSDEDSGSERVIAIVSHGMLLSTLWRCLLRRLPAKSVSVAPDILASKPFVDLEHLGGWTNTGYLELQLIKRLSSAPTMAETGHVSALAEPSKVETGSSSAFTDSEKNSVNTTHDTTIAKDSLESTTDSDLQQTSGPWARPSGQLSPSASNLISPQIVKVLGEWTTTIIIINEQAHLRGLKRTGGGVGSAKFEEGQKTIETFFKRRKVG